VTRVVNPSLQDRFRGCLVGLACGDALGGRFEAQSADHIRSRVPTVERLISSVADALWYTDDTQMAIGVAETLAADCAIVERRLCRAVVADYVPSRGYGRGARAVLEAMEDGRDYRGIAEKHFPDRIEWLVTFRFSNQSWLSRRSTNLRPSGCSSASRIRDDRQWRLAHTATGRAEFPAMRPLYFWVVR
jgi:hypothetical protein